ncbi:Frt2p NDAI_0H02580 [Naumovozyma dairenensis CBS 421]|uniref:Uncharacterized protein n=1 Tax=Naumovozyma dairenensis (strain ATCC 10597 / BCRC 20456 / CBS 421 / NBRC 0211 / NRRL Y-12639) TaxID=1071378 RepID=G0WF71_NAUDC|nr:hypothetical protein NDAI_0H02580 [Naumovozyma dairenensis CBS 421]CCD26432.1 hypothetical protein NDAI_0H02580 [Naumovozyma dairenensis CBS 421]
MDRLIARMEPSHISLEKSEELPISGNISSPSLTRTRRKLLRNNRETSWVPNHSTSNPSSSSSSSLSSSASSNAKTSPGPPMQNSSPVSPRQHTDVNKLPSRNTSKTSIKQEDIAPQPRIPQIKLNDHSIMKNNEKRIGTDMTEEDDNEDDKPILIRRTSRKNLASLLERAAKKKVHRAPTTSTKQVDYSSSNTGTFSECMFKSTDDFNAFNKTDDSLANLEGENDAISAKLGLSNSSRNKLRSSSSSPYERDKNKKNLFIDIKGNIVEEVYKVTRIKKSFNSLHDKDRLINQFLQPRNGLPSSSLQLKFSGTMTPLDHRSGFTGSLDHSNKSLQSLLYHDLENPSTTTSSFLYREDQVSPSHFLKLSRGSESSEAMDSNSSSSTSSSSSLRSSASSSRSSSSESISSHSSSFTSDSSASVSSKSSSIRHTNSPGKSSSFEDSELNDALEDMDDDLNTTTTTDLTLDINEVGYYDYHMSLRLKNCELMMKDNLKNIILQRENELSKNLSNFDLQYDDLKRIRGQIINLQKLVENDYLVILREDFNAENKNSFESHLTKILDMNVTKLEELEIRMKNCADRLNQQKETMKKLESLSFLENSLKISKKNSKFLYKYWFLLYDLLVLGFLLLLAYFVTHKRYG